MSNARILVCDDDELLVELLQFRLSAKGFEVLAAEHGQAAMTIATDAKIDAVVLDAMMPQLDGYEVLRRLREMPATSTVPVIMLTARKGERDIVEALRLGASDYLAKPFMPEELIARLLRLLPKTN
ncbi:response regulator [Sphingomonas kaistensis]|uniref:Response regulator n=1 Tax=Sphingomonas kaistensis TaxID=298708 RepID=A0ABZ2G2R7_9SPHN